MPPADPSSQPIKIDHLADRGRFRAIVEGLECELDYTQVDGVMSIMHTGVPAQLEGRGIAAALTRTALEHAQATGLKVRPLCSYAVSYMQRHPETAALRA